MTHPDQMVSSSSETSARQRLFEVLGLAADDQSLLTPELFTQLIQLGMSSHPEQLETLAEIARLRESERLAELIGSLKAELSEGSLYLAEFEAFMETLLASATQIIGRAQERLQSLGLDLEVDQHRAESFTQPIVALVKERVQSALEAEIEMELADTVLDPRHRAANLLKKASMVLQKLDTDPQLKAQIDEKLAAFYATINQRRKAQCDAREAEDAAQAAADEPIGA